MNKVIYKLKQHFFNIPGWKTRRKIIVFESDDWGTIRMPNSKAYDSLLQHGIRVDLSLYDKLDSLERRADFDNLINLLSSYKGTNGQSPVFTLNTVMTNPDFDAIEKSGFENYFNINFFKSYHTYYGEDLQDLWQQGKGDGLIKPQFHAREHLNVPLWMNDLQQGLKDVRLGFNHGFFGLKTATSSISQKHYLAAYRAETSTQFKAISDIAENGLKLFEETFGYKSKSFIAANYIWPKELEAVLKANGVEYIQTQRGQVAPVLDNNKIEINRHFLGSSNELKQYYLVRNVNFEPYENQDIDWVNKTMSDISTAFFWNKPAIISTHRINYASNMSVENRDLSLKKLDHLLKSIIKKWPDVIFMSSDELGNLIKQKE